ncbi:hypothetical protein BT96DRAFT_1016867 [Gymnopus androsaceus JB14]|uniref:Uncharacterized protein n=1 Tax=Gymnopus androsaceus JB14 TaxID=1447944 RepID=A0A6A4HZY5_9AGAR|nr:hypothetical protein BT96DRAFT_1016867 [Gymnopus androsaceus JB14]
MFNARHHKSYDSETAPKEHVEYAKEKQSTMQDQASPLEGYPLQHAVAAGAGKLICPTSISHPERITEVPFARGDNLFWLTWRHYSQTILSDQQPGSNYVSTDGIAMRLHEYLGPSPAVSGFVVEDGKATILFYDLQLKKSWSVHGPWKMAPLLQRRKLDVITRIPGDVAGR